MERKQDSGVEYALGHSEHELERLSTQGRLYEPFTESFFRNAGLTAGMRVLDVGCGAGDVSFLVARLVGPTGQVTGVDRSAVAVATARERAQNLNLLNTRFVTGDVGALAFEETFDAVVGRFVLMHNPNPTALLRQLVTHVRPGGVIAFQEADWMGYRTLPPLPTWDQCVRWIIAAQESSGSDLYLGLKLFAIFTAVGLLPPSLSVNAVIAAGADHPLYTHAADLVTTLLPVMERQGIASASEVEADTLATRLRDEVLTANGTVVWVSLIGAAARKSAEQ